jgi:hypothetical protein
MPGAKKPVKFIDNWSESSWVSLVVKALRLGWPAGIEAARLRLAPSRVRDTLIVQVFEDIFPAVEELPAVLAECRAHQYAALCRRQTHHGRPGLTDLNLAINDLWADGTRRREAEAGRLYAEATRLGLWLAARAFADFDAWLTIKPTDAGATREIDPAPWSAMPAAMADLHTYEGKLLKAGETLLSGTAAGHRNLARLVQADGWAAVRRLVHAQHLTPPAAPAAANP